MLLSQYKVRNDILAFNCYNNNKKKKELMPIILKVLTQLSHRLYKGVRAYKRLILINITINN